MTDGTHSNGETSDPGFLFYRQQIIAMASSYSCARAGDYGARAEDAYAELKKLAGLFIAHFNNVNPEFQVVLSGGPLAQAVVNYFREVLEHKIVHGIAVDRRLDTHICGGLWMCHLLRFDFFDASRVPEHLAVKDALRYMCLRGNFAFGFGYKVLGQHRSFFAGAALMNLLEPVRKYIREHADELSKSTAGCVGIFRALLLLLPGKK